MVILLTDLLKAYGYEVIQAFEGHRGIELAIENTPDLIILDMIMPDLTGFEVVPRLRGNSKTKDIPILIYTSKDLNSNEEQQLKLQVQGIVQKTSGKGELIQEIKKWVGSPGLNQENRV